MLPKIKALALVCMLLALGTNAFGAQLTANAGRDTTICFGDTVVLGGNPTATGPTPPYTYFWSPAAGISSVTAANPSVMPVVTTTYTVTVVDAFSLSVTASITITVGQPLHPDFSVPFLSQCLSTPVTFTDLSTPQGNITGWSWDFGDGNNQAVQNPTHTYATAGTYPVTLTIANAICSADTTINVTIRNAPTSTFTVVSPVCVGQNAAITYTGSASQLASYTWNFDGGNISQGGVQGPYQVKWTTGGNKNITLSVTENGCTSAITTEPIVVNALPPLSVSPNTSIACGGNTTLTASGATSYTWSPVWDLSSSTTAAVTATPPYTRQYFVTGTISNGCSATDSVTVTVTGGPQIDSVIAHNVTCFNGSNGSVCAYASGTGGPFTYSWSNGETGQCITNLAAAVYVVTITNASLCATTASATISQATQLSVPLVVTNITCYGLSNGSISASVTGGTAPYTFMWSNSATGQPITGLTAGTYVVTVVDFNGCTASNSVTVTQPVKLVVDTILNTSAACGSNNGILTVQVSGGIPVYRYLWAVGGETTQAVTGLTAGTYCLTVNDANACTATACGTVSTSAAVVIDSIRITNLTCNGSNDGQLCVYAHGGVMTPYLWSNGATSQCISGLAPGIYTVTATNTNGCSATATAIVTQPTQILITPVVTNVACYGASTGSIVAAVNGGAAPYTYLWSNTATSQSIAGLPAAIYGVTVIDSRLCSADGQATIIQPTQLIIDTIYGGGGTCGTNNGTLTPAFSGGTPGYTFAWSGGFTTQNISGLTAGTYCVTVGDSHACTVTGCGTVSASTPVIIDSLHVTNLTCYGSNNGAFCVYASGVGSLTYNWNNGAIGSCITGLSAGIYSVTVSNASGCSASASATVTQPTQITQSLQLVNADCSNVFNGTITVTANGGIPPYTYGLNGGPLQSQNLLNGLSAGVYLVDVVDNTGCLDTLSATIQNAYSVSEQVTNSTNSLCQGGTDTITAAIIGGIPPYSFSINGITWQSSGAFGIQTPGDYIVTARDSHGCTAFVFDTIIAFPPMTTTVNSSNVSCFGDDTGSSCLTVSGGSAPYSFFWSNFQNGACINGLIAGTYYVIATDANGCQIRDSAIITQPAQLIIDSLPVTYVTCVTNNATITAYVNGGTGSYTYSWSDGEFDVNPIANLSAATYSLTVVDANSCTATGSAVVNQPAVVTIDSLHINNVSCFNNADGGICAYPSGGTQFFYVWSNAQITQCDNSLNAGAYVVTVTNNSGCSASASGTITQPPSAFILDQVLTPDSNAIPDSVWIAVSGGVPPYLYNWDDGHTNNTGAYVYQTTGIYMDTITDASGCILTYRVDAGCNDQCVWPGDANYDGIVDNNDLLPIGLGYDSTGYSRLTPTINFIPQYCQNWADTLSGGINYKHIDCNGDGLIDAADTNAIMLNYGYTHPRSGGRPAWRSGIPALYIKISPDTLVDGDIATATLSLGDSAMPCTNVYALAFTYNYNPLVVDTGSVSINFGNSWLAGAGDHINVSKNLYGPGQLQAALTRINHINRSGSGVVATVSMKITTGNINGKNMLYYMMNNFISNLTVIDNRGNVLPYNEGADSAQIGFVPTGIPSLANATNIQLYPNPAADQLNITNAGGGVEDISIVDLTGQQVYHQSTLVTGNVTIDISQLSAGVYMVNLKTSGHEYHSRFVKAPAK